MWLALSRRNRERESAARRVAGIGVDKADHAVSAPTAEAKVSGPVAVPVISAGNGAERVNCGAGCEFAATVSSPVTLSVTAGSPIVRPNCLTATDATAICHLNRKGSGHLGLGTTRNQTRRRVKLQTIRQGTGRHRPNQWSNRSRDGKLSGIVDPHLTGRQRRGCREFWTLDLLIVSKNGAVATCGAGVELSVAWTVNENVPVFDGVPLSSPLDESVTPAGKVPLVADHVSFPTPPLAVSCWLYATPATPGVKGETDVILNPVTTVSLARADAFLPERIRHLHGERKGAGR